MDAAATPFVRKYPWISLPFPESITDPTPHQIKMHELMEETLNNVGELRERWQMDASWHTSSALEWLYIPIGRMLYTAALGQEAHLYGFQEYNDITIDGFKIHWYDNKNDAPLRRLAHKPNVRIGKPNSTKKPPETLVLLHGLSSEKNHWLRFARSLRHAYRIVIPDLPGHGHTNYRSNASYSSDYQAKRLLTWLDKLGIDNFHVAGNSMGGLISCRIAHMAPERVNSLCLIDAAGLPARTHSQLEHSIEVGRNPFIVHSVAEFNEFKKMAAQNTPWIPKPINVALAYQNYERRERWFGIMRELVEEIYPEAWLVKAFPTFNMPIHVMWGQNDQLLSADMANHFAELNPRVQTVCIEGVGHIPMLEAPHKTAKHYAEFLKGF